MKILTINSKMSGTGTIHDLASDQYDRVIKFKKGEKFCVILPAYFGDWSTNCRSEEAAVKKAMQTEHSQVIDTEGHRYAICNDYLERI